MLDRCAVINDLAVNNGIQSLCKYFHRISVKNGNIRIFPHFQAAHSVVYTTDPGRIDCDGTIAFNSNPAFTAMPAQRGRDCIRETG